MTAPTDRTRLRRMADRGSYDREVIDAVLDEGLVCHVGFVSDGEPRVLPTAHVRVGDSLYLHGATGNHMLRSLENAPVCVTVTLLDGLVLARSAFHHSMNYRSVVVYGTAEPVTDHDAKRTALDALVEHIKTGRSGVARPPTDGELRATRLVRIPLAEASAKIRTGPPVDDPDDMGLDVWAGVIPLSLEAGEPVADD